MRTSLVIPKRHAFGRIAATTMVILIGATLGLSVGRATATTATPYNKNLILNPGFEAGLASDGYHSVSVPNWDLSPNATVVAYGTAGGFPTRAEGHRISGSRQFLTSGWRANDNVVCASATQAIFIHGRNTAIDSGRVAVVFSGRLGTYGVQPDTATLAMLSWDGAGESTGAGVLSQTHTNGQLFRLSNTQVLGPQTRTITIDLYAENAAGYCDAYFDRISVRLIRV